MNNNRGNNRRRGRGNNRQQGGQQINRIDSRARGNAPQLLEKYRKLAHDAHLNGDRVTEEYYLQFADHYFRVIADQRQRQEESRQPRRDDRGEYGDDYASDDDGYAEYPQNRAAPEQPARQRQDSEPRAEVQEAPAEAPEQAAPETDEPRSVYEPPENPFIRDGRASRGLKQRKPRKPRGEDSGEAAGDDAEGEAPAGFDPSTLPPSISARSGGEEAEGAAEPKPRARRRTRKPAAESTGEGDSDGNLEAVN